MDGCEQTYNGEQKAEGKGEVKDFKVRERVRLSRFGQKTRSRKAS